AFSWISTKISMSAKRRTTPLVRGTPIPSAMACASAGFELPAISLMEPFLADMDASCLALLDTTFSISLLTPSPAGFVGRGDIRDKRSLATRLPRFPGQKRPENAGLRGSVGVVGERPVNRFGGRYRGPAFSRGRGGRRRFDRRAVDHAGEAAQAGLGDSPQHHVIGGGPGIAAGFSGGLLAVQAQRALLA